MFSEATPAEKTRRTMETFRKEQHMKEMEADNTQLHDVIGAYQAREGKWQEALEEAQKALRQAEKENTALRNEIDAYQTREGEFQAALEETQAELYEMWQKNANAEFAEM